MNQTELAHIVGVSPSAVGGWLRDGMPCRVPGGRGRATDIDLQAALAWLAKRGIRPNVARDHALVVPIDSTATDDDETAADDGPDYKASRAKREHYAAAREEIRYKQETGELIVAADVEAEFATACTKIRTALEALPESLAPRLAALTDEGACRSLLADEIERMLAQLSDDLALITAT